LSATSCRRERRERREPDGHILKCTYDDSDRSQGYADGWAIGVPSVWLRHVTECFLVAEVEATAGGWVEV
jgi:hypothetical protein